MTNGSKAGWVRYLSNYWVRASSSLLYPQKPSGGPSALATARPIGFEISLEVLESGGEPGRS
jgi:hypothetical protein